MTGWTKGDRVRVSPSHYGTGLQTRVGTVLRTTGKYIEVELDSLHQAGTGIVSFSPEDLEPSTTKRGRKTRGEGKPTFPLFFEIGDEVELKDHPLYRDGITGVVRDQIHEGVWVMELDDREGSSLGITGTTACKISPGLDPI